MYSNEQIKPPLWSNICEVKQNPMNQRAFTMVLITNRFRLFSFQKENHMDDMFYRQQLCDK